MYWIAFTLGFFGSLHCVGMCGPLAFGTLAHRGRNTLGLLWPTFFYNIGRVLSYSTLGVILGILGGIASLAGFQKAISISFGAILVGLALFSVNLDHLIGKQKFIKKLYNQIAGFMSSAMKKGRQIPAIQVGVINGLLPCGLVYVALMAAITLSNIWGTVGFMVFFGLGTFPAMFLVILLPTMIQGKVRMSLQRLYPILMGLTGFYLIYRGVMSKLPLQLNFIDALNHPIMCH
ncbi:MAG: sulfite exporter TauE/SafE family protein [Saprospiraceae bacterium]